MRLSRRRDPDPLTTMYASEATVRTLAKNVGNRLATELISAVALAVDDEIDGRLATVYDWPATKTDPLQSRIQSVANLMTAGRLEQSSYAQVEGAQEQKLSYGRILELQGIKLLNQIVAGQVYVPGLDRTLAVATSTPTRVSDTKGYGGVKGSGRR